MHEIIRSMDMSRQPGMVLKLYISKAYDKVNWDFLFKVLMKLSKLIDLIRECATTMRYAVLVNGIPKGSFRETRGIRKGYPSSPYLFIILMEVMGRIFLNLIRRGKL